jgi:hypothetical protein
LAEDYQGGDYDDEDYIDFDWVAAEVDYYFSSLVGDALWAFSAEFEEQTERLASLATYITRKILKNKDGGTVDGTGKDYSLGDRPASGYGVAFKKFETVYVIDDFFDFSELFSVILQKLRELEFQTNKKEEVGEIRPHYLGWWTDENSGSLYMDLVAVISNKQAALKLARDQQQLAIFDFSNSSTLYI